MADVKRVRVDHDEEDLLRHEDTEQQNLYEEWLLHQLLGRQPEDEEEEEEDVDAWFARFCKHQGVDDQEDRSEWFERLYDRILHDEFPELLFEDEPSSVVECDRREAAIVKRLDDP